jgi:hypothetical protein
MSFQPADTKEAEMELVIIPGALDGITDIEDCYAAAVRRFPGAPVIFRDGEERILLEIGFFSSMNGPVRACDVERIPTDVGEMFQVIRVRCAESH